MSDKEITMRPGNKGLTVKVNFWSMEKYLDGIDSQYARLWMLGQVTHADNGDVEKFHDAGELISILGKWNTEKYKELKAMKEK